MTRGFQTLATVALLCAGIADSRAVAKEETPLKRDYPIVAVPFTDVHVSDAFWSPRLELNRKVTIPYAFKQCEETGRIDNFAIAGKLKQGKFKGIFFNDSDVFKVMEGAAYALAVQPDPQLDKYLDDLIAKVAAAQEPDGYLYTARTLCGPDYMPPGGKERWSDMAGGHEFVQRGTHVRSGRRPLPGDGKRTFLNVAIKNANLVCSVFGPGRNPNPCGIRKSRSAWSSSTGPPATRNTCKWPSSSLTPAGEPRDASSSATTARTTNRSSSRPKLSATPFGPDTCMPVWPTWLL